MSRSRRDAVKDVPIHLHSVSRPVGYLAIDRKAFAEDAAEYLQAGRFADITKTNRDIIREIIYGYMNHEQIMAAKDASVRLRDAIELALASAGFPQPPTRPIAKDKQTALDILIRRPGGVLAEVETVAEQLRAATKGKRGPVPAPVPFRVLEHVIAHSPRIESAVRDFRKKVRLLHVEDRYEPAERFLKETLSRPVRGAKLRDFQKALASPRSFLKNSENGIDRSRRSYYHASYARRTPRARVDVQLCLARAADSERSSAPGDSDPGR